MCKKIHCNVEVAEGGENADRFSMEVDHEDEKKIKMILKYAKEQGKQTVEILNITGAVDVGILPFNMMKIIWHEGRKIVSRRTYTRRKSN